MIENRIFYDDGDIIPKPCGCDKYLNSSSPCHIIMPFSYHYLFTAFIQTILSSHTALTVTVTEAMI